MCQARHGKQAHIQAVRILLGPHQAIYMVGSAVSKPRHSWDPVTLIKLYGEHLPSASFLHNCQQLYCLHLDPRQLHAFPLLTDCTLSEPKPALPEGTYQGTVLQQHVREQQAQGSPEPRAAKRLRRYRQSNSHMGASVQSSPKQICFLPQAAL